jgi:hypothetical protein
MPCRRNGYACIGASGATYCGPPDAGGAVPDAAADAPGVSSEAAAEAGHGSEADAELGSDAEVVAE